MNPENIVGHKWKNSFVIHGTVVDADKEGITLQTDQKTSWVSFSQLEDIIVEDEHD